LFISEQKRKRIRSNLNGWTTQGRDSKRASTKEKKKRRGASLSRASRRRKETRKRMEKKKNSMNVTEGLEVGAMKKESSHAGNE